jgi:hypothetical protein
MQLEKQVEEWHFDTEAQGGDEDDVIISKSAEDSADHFGVNLSLLIRIADCRFRNNEQPEFREVQRVR